MKIIKNTVLFLILTSCSVAFAVPKVGTTARYEWCIDWAQLSNASMRIRDDGASPKKAYSILKEGGKVVISSGGKRKTQSTLKVNDKELKNLINEVYFGEFRYFHSLPSSYLNNCIQPPQPYKPLK